MPGKRATSRCQLRGQSAIAQFGPESLVHRWVSPSSTLSFRPDPTRTSELVRLARASLPERPPRLNGGFPTNVVNTPRGKGGPPREARGGATRPAQKISRAAVGPRPAFSFLISGENELSLCGAPGEACSRRPAVSCSKPSNDWVEVLPPSGFMV